MPLIDALEEGFVNPPASMHPGLCCELVTEFSRLEALSFEWQRLARNNHSGIFQSWEWAAAYWKTYGRNLSLCAIAIHQNDRLAGILPLVQRGTVVEFLGSLESDYNDLLSEPSREAAVLQAALEFLCRGSFKWESGILENLPARSNIVRSISTLPSNLRRHLQLVFRCPAPAIVADPKAETLEALINKEQLRRAERKLQKLGRLVFRHIETRDEARQNLNHFFHQHITRWAMNGFRSNFLQPERRAFYGALIEELDPAGQLRFGVLELDSRPIAYHFGFELDGTLTWYKPTFDINYWDASPGDALLRSLFQYSKQAGVSEFDFTIGDEGYKHRFANETRSNYDVYVERIPARAKSYCNKIARHALHHVRQRPAVKAVLRGWVRRAGAAAAGVRSLFDKMLPNWLDACRSAYRKGMVTRQEMLLFSGALGAPGNDSTTPIAPAGLDVLALLSVEHPDLVPAGELHKYRHRLKRGDRVFVGGEQGQQPSLLWLGNQSNIALPQFGRDSAFVLPRPGLVLYDCRIPPDGDRSENVAAMLRGLARYLPDGAELWIPCPREEGTLRRAAERANFQLTHVLQHRAFLYTLRRTRIQSVREPDDSQRTAPYGSSICALL